MSRLSNAQGSFELIESLIHSVLVIPSWWFGHKATNGLLAKWADRRLAEKFNIKPGILVEPDDVNKKLPEPAKIQHILNRTEHNAELCREARKEHAKTLYGGFALHSAIIFALKMFVNKLTKTRALSSLKSMS